MKLLSNAEQLGCKLALILKEVNLKLTQSDGNLLEDPFDNIRLMRILLYLTMTILDLCFVVHKSSQFVAFPPSSHFKAALKVIQYVKGIVGQGLFLSTKSI